MSGAQAQNKLRTPPDSYPNFLLHVFSGFLTWKMELMFIESICLEIRGLAVGHCRLFLRVIVEFTLKWAKRR